MKQLEAKIVHNLNILSKMNAVNIYWCYTASAFVAVQLKLFRLGLNARRQEVTLCMQTQLKKAGICCWENKSEICSFHTNSRRILHRKTKNPRAEPQHVSIWYSKACWDKYSTVHRLQSNGAVWWASTEMQRNVNSETIRVCVHRRNAKAEMYL